MVRLPRKIKKACKGIVNEIDLQTKAYWYIRRQLTGYVIIIPTNPADTSIKWNTCQGEELNTYIYTYCYLKWFNKSLRQ